MSPPLDLYAVAAGLEDAARASPEMLDTEPELCLCTFHDLTTFPETR